MSLFLLIFPLLLTLLISPQGPPLPLGRCLSHLTGAYLTLTLTLCFESVNNKLIKIESVNKINLLFK